MRDEKTNRGRCVMHVHFWHYWHTGTIFKLEGAACRDVGFLAEPIVNIKLSCFHDLRFLK